MPTPYGQIFVHWARTGHRLSLTITVPAHATAFIELPGGHQVTLPGGAHGAQRTLTG